jgi:hypothetical protein
MAMNKTNNKLNGRKAVNKAIAEQDSENAQKASLSQEQIQEAIRLKAYELYEQRGRTPGHHENDWLMAERIVMGTA